MNVHIETIADAKFAPCAEVHSFLRDHNQRTNPGLMSSLDAPNSRIPINLIASSDQVVIGGLLGFTESKWLRIDIMAVHPDFQRNGIGTSLLNEAEKIALERGCSYAFLDTLENQAPHFYLNYGFIQAGVIPDWDSHGNAKFFLTRPLEEQRG